MGPLPLFSTSCETRHVCQILKPHGFQSQGCSLTCAHTCLRTVNLRVTSGATSAYSTNRSVHCFLCVYGRLASRTSLMQAPEGRQWWIANMGSSEISGRPLNKRACLGLLGAKINGRSHLKVFDIN